MNNNSINSRNAVQIQSIAASALAGDSEAVSLIAAEVKALRKEVLSLGWRLTDTEALCLLSSGCLHLVRRLKHPASHRHGGHNGCFLLKLLCYDTLKISVINGPTWWGSRLPQKYHKWINVNR